MADLSLVDASGSDLKSFVVLANAVAIGNNKSMLSLLNATGSGVVVKIRSLKIINSQTSNVSGTISDFQFIRFTEHTGGTSLTPQSLDTEDSLNVNVTARTNATISGAGATLYRWLWSSDEWSSGYSKGEGFDHFSQNTIPLIKNDLQSSLKPVTIRPGEGVHILHAINSTNGTFDFIMEFTEE